MGVHCSWAPLLERVRCLARGLRAGPHLKLVTLNPLCVHDEDELPHAQDLSRALVWLWHGHTTVDCWKTVYLNALQFCGGVVPRRSRGAGRACCRGRDALLARHHELSYAMGQSTAFEGAKHPQPPAHGRLHTGAQCVEPLIDLQEARSGQRDCNEEAGRAQDPVQQEDGRHKA